MFLDEWNNADDFVEVQTSGSTGVPKVLRVSKCRMAASARMTLDFLRLNPNDNALLCLPDKYIAGKMMIVRSIIGRLNLISIQPSGNPLLDVCQHIHFAAFTPMQVYNMLQDRLQRDRFSQIDKVIIGGGAISPSMSDELRGMSNEVWSTYGMTETLSHIAMRRLSGPAASDWYTPLNGVNVSANEDGCLVVEAPHVAEDILTTNDIAEINAEGQFRILGRKDNVVCSGGIKLQIEQLEAKIAQRYKGEFALSWLTDERLGQALTFVALFGANKEQIVSVCDEVLDRVEQPKSIIFVEEIPHTETNKIARGRLHDLIQSL